MDPILHLSLPVADLEAARRFYVEDLGCSPGRVDDGWIDVWFYGMQLTLHERPEQVPAADGPRSVRHFGVTLDRSELDALLDRLRGRTVRWVEPITTGTGGRLAGKTSAKIADPSGNVVELKSYPADDAAPPGPPRA
ncbi:MAG TPA: VOC family protein [Acidimicrobiia bacterium]